jgi:hypothetical protein
MNSFSMRRKLKAMSKEPLLGLDFVLKGLTWLIFYEQKLQLLYTSTSMKLNASLCLVPD